VGAWTQEWPLRPLGLVWPPHGQPSRAVLGRWEPTRGPKAPARSVRCGGAPLSARRNKNKRESFNHLCEKRGVANFTREEGPRMHDILEGMCELLHAQA